MHATAVGIDHHRREETGGEQRTHDSAPQADAFFRVHPGHAHPQQHHAWGAREQPAKNYADGNPQQEIPGSGSTLADISTDEPLTKAEC